MATVNYTAEVIIPHKVIRLTWAALANGDDGQPAEYPLYSDRTVQVKGTPGAGGNCRIEGSDDDGTTYAVLTDPQGNDLDITTAKREMITELAGKTRPRVTAGDGTTALTVIMTLKVP